MLSRIADSLFWLNRYMERSEGLLRVIHTNYILSLDDGTANLSWRPILELFSNANEEQVNELEFQTNKAIQYLIAGERNNNSLKEIIGKARENARGIQDHITKEVWEHVNQMYHHTLDQRFNNQLYHTDVLPLIDELLRSTILYAGIIDTTMPRGIGWSFMNLGRLTERCLLTTQLARRQFEETTYNSAHERDILYWRNLLLSLSGYEHHLKTYRSTDTHLNVVDQLILDKNFPRSVKYSLNRIEKYMQDVVKGNQSQEARQLSLEYSRFNSRIQFADMFYIQQQGVIEFLGQVQKDLYQFTNQLGQTFFSYS
ncbi:MAG: alpha-E domain-containing protein [Chitinophagaceae bacterium]